MIYDVAPGVLIETPDDRLLDEDELAQARDRYATGKVSLEKVARDVGAKPWSAPEPERKIQVAVDYDQLVAALGPEKAAEILGAQPEPAPGA